MNRVAIIVLNWNGIEDTIPCLDSLLQQTFSNFKIIVVDNGSKDGSINKLKSYQDKHADKINVIYNATNLGFAGGVNTGIKWAIDNQYDMIALFNNDATADEDWLRNLEQTISKDNTVGIATGLLLHADGKTIDSSGDWYSKWGLPFPRNRNDDYESAPTDGFVFGASGGATLYRSAIFDHIGLFDEDFFAYYEDADISFRAQLAGWKVFYTSSAIAYHKQGATSSKIPGFSVRQTFKNLPWLLIKNVPFILLLPVGIRFSLAYVLILVNSIKNGTGIFAIRGVFECLVLLPKKIAERKRIQKTKIASTGYIISILWDDLPPDQSGLRKLRKVFTGK